jgi:hypothetical protein
MDELSLGRNVHCNPDYVIVKLGLKLGFKENATFFLEVEVLEMRIALSVLPAACIIGGKENIEIAHIFLL